MASQSADEAPEIRQASEQLGSSAARVEMSVDEESAAATRGARLSRPEMRMVLVCMLSLVGRLENGIRTRLACDGICNCKLAVNECSCMCLKSFSGQLE